MKTFDISKQLHAKTVMDSLANDAKLPDKIPKHFSDKFEQTTYSVSDHGNKITSARWQRNLDGDTLPRLSFINTLPESYRKTKEIYFSSIWLALKPELPSSKKLIKFFGSLPCGICRILGVDKPTQITHLNSLLIAPAKIVRIYQRLDIDALACLFVLMRLEQLNEPRRRLDKNPMNFRYQRFESYVYILILQLIDKRPFSEFATDTIRCIVNNVISPQSNELCNQPLWRQKPDQIIAQNADIRECVYYAKKYGIVKNNQEKANFLFYLLWCPRR